jgi:hypothetical protein
LKGQEDERERLRAAQAAKPQGHVAHNPPALDPDYEKELLARRKEKLRKQREAERQRHQGDLPIIGRLGSAIADMFDPVKKEDFESAYLNDQLQGFGDLCEMYTVGREAPIHYHHHHNPHLVRRHLERIRSKRRMRQAIAMREDEAANNTSSGDVELIEKPLRKKKMVRRDNQWINDESRIKGRANVPSQGTLKPRGY